jgi:hypothetical protein
VIPGRIARQEELDLMVKAVLFSEREGTPMTASSLGPLQT